MEFEKDNNEYYSNTYSNERLRDLWRIYDHKIEFALLQEDDETVRTYREKIDKIIQVLEWRGVW